VLEPIGQHAERERLGSSDCGFAGVAVSEHAWKLRDLGDPPPVCLLVHFEK
jgi:hypothetical protein